MTYLGEVTDNKQLIIKSNKEIVQAGLMNYKQLEKRFNILKSKWSNT